MVQFTPKAGHIDREAMETPKARAATAIRTVRCPVHGRSVHISHYDPETTQVLVVGCCASGVEAGIAAINSALTEPTI